MVKFINRCKVQVASGGTSTLTFGSAVASFESLADQSVVDADQLRYTLEQGNEYEVGTGVIGLSGSTYRMTRTPLRSSNSDNSAINAGASAICFFTMLANDVTQYLADLANVSDTSPSGGQSLTWDAAAATWKPASPSGSIVNVSTYANLPGSPSVTDLAFVTDTKALYIYDGTEWDRINSGSDALPEITTALPATLGILPSAANVVTIAANDPDGFPITYDFDTNPTDVSSLVSSVNNANNGTYTINTTSGSGSFTFRAKANDGVHTSITTSVFTIIPNTPVINSISPALPSGHTSWNLDTDGPINLDAGETYTFTAAGQFAVDFEVFGAGGGSTDYAYGSYKGGGGSRTTGRTTLQYQETYTIVVGGKGREGGTVPSGGSQGSGGDGGGAQIYTNAGGGDLSGLFKGSGDIATFAAQGHGSSSHIPIAIAGGGGGSGSNANGGFGGGTSGGVVSPQSGTAPTGGSQTAGGTGGVGGTRTGADGVYLIGGQGALAGGTYTGSGAGGGYFGGGGGGYESAAYIQGAAGGSGYFNTSLVTSGVLTDGDSTSVALTYLNGTSQTSGKGAQNGSDNGTDGRVKLTKVT
tara:strand:- start:3630 stop:5384 length:1755 start_codon:yes stop_codon:yes gene_type:complete